MFIIHSYKIIKNNIYSDLFRCFPSKHYPSITKLFWRCDTVGVEEWMNEIMESKRSIYIIVRFINEKFDFNARCNITTKSFKTVKSKVCGSNMLDEQPNKPLYQKKIHCVFNLSSTITQKMLNSQKSIVSSLVISKFLWFSLKNFCYSSIKNCPFSAGWFKPKSKLAQFKQ